jgi:hypothetical protein
MKVCRQKSIKIILAMLIFIISLSPLTGVKVRADKKPGMDTCDNVEEISTLPMDKGCTEKIIKNLVICIDVIHFSI